MSDFTEGQKAIIKGIFTESLKDIDEQLEKRFKASDAQLEETILRVFNEQKQLHEANRIPYWKFWKRKDSLGVVAGVFIVVVAFVADRASGKLYLDNFIHEIIGTKQIVTAEISDKDSTINDGLESFLSSYMSKTTSKDHPIPKAVKKILNSKPILIFQGEQIFGRKKSIKVQNKKCIEAIVPATSQELPENALQKINEKCVFEGELESDNTLSLPFYGTFWKRDGSPAHDIYLLISVSRITRNIEKMDTYKSPFKTEGLAVRLVSSEDVNASPIYTAGQSGEIDVTPHISEAKNNFYFADLGALYRGSKKYQAGLDFDPTFLHSIVIETSSEYVNDINEYIAIRTLVLINRKPNQIAD